MNGTWGYKRDEGRWKGGEELLQGGAGLQPAAERGADGGRAVPSRGRRSGCGSWRSIATRVENTGWRPGFIAVAVYGHAGGFAHSP